MGISFLRSGEALAAVLAVCGMGYYVLCLLAARSFLREAARIRFFPPAEFTPPVSILKPVRGAERGMYESFRSHCLQEYPDYELVFGVLEEHDPAVALVERLRLEFPQRQIRLLVCPQALGANLKVSNLVQMLPQAAHRHLIVNDSDIRVAPDYLRRVMAPFADPKVGMVTALYRGAPGTTLASRLESVGISTDFIAGVLVARHLEHGVRFGLGSTLAFTRTALDAIGGFEPLLDYLADDYELGCRIARAGMTVVLSDLVVDTFVPDYDWRGFWAHQQRWARGIRDSRKLGYMGVALTFGVPWALIALLLSRGMTWAWLLFVAALLLRFFMAVVVGAGVLQDTGAFLNLWLVPVRDCVALAVWAGAYAGHTIHWRGNDFVLQSGRLRPASKNGSLRPHLPCKD